MKSVNLQIMDVKMIFRGYDHIYGHGWLLFSALFCIIKDINKDMVT